MTVPYLKLFPDLSVTVDMLSDAEAGRLLKSLLHYGNGQVDEMPGNERFIFSMLRVQIDRDAATYQDMIDRQRTNGKKGGAPKGNKNAAKQPGGCFENNPNNPNNPDKEEEEDKDKDEENIGAPPPARARARESAEITLTAEDVEAARHLDDTIRSAAQNAGLTVTPDGLEYGRRLAVTYGLDALLDAIHKAVDNPRWRYVEGILSTPDKPRQAFTGRQPRRNTVQDKLAQLQADIERGKYSDAS